MKISETAEVLTKIAAFDRRTLGEADVAAWHEVIGDLGRDDVMEAVRRWYGNNTAWIMPAHVRELVRELEHERNVSQWAPGQYGVPRDQAHPELAAGERLGFFELPAEVRELLAQVPKGNPLALHPRRAAWEREHAAYRRQADAQPNPYYDPTPLCPSCEIRHGLPIHHD